MQHLVNTHSLEVNIKLISMHRGKYQKVVIYCYNIGQFYLKLKLITGNNWVILYPKLYKINNQSNLIL